MSKRRELTVAEKTRIIAFHQQGVSFRRIEKQLRIARSTCNKVCQKWLAQGSVDTRKRSGRPVKFTPRVVAAINDLIKANDEATSKDIEKELVRRFGGAYSSSARSIRRIRERLGYTAVKGVGQDILTADHKKERVAFCKRHSKDQFSNVVFTDEKPWELGKRRIRIWQKKGAPRKVFQRQKYPPKIQCWGGISKKGKTPLRIWKGRQNSTFYQETLETTLLPFADSKLPTRWRLQQDRDTTHTSKSSQTWVSVNVPNSFFTPAKSPDLNPIEKVWAILEQRVYKRQPKTVEQLERAILEEWEKIDQNTIDNCINHSIKLIPLIVTAKGEYVESKRGYRH
jgi:transposase